MNIYTPANKFKTIDEFINYKNIQKAKKVKEKNKLISLDLQIKN